MDHKSVTYSTSPLPDDLNSDEYKQILDHGLLLKLSNHSLAPPSAYNNLCSNFNAYHPLSFLWMARVKRWDDTLVRRYRSICCVCGSEISGFDHSMVRRMAN
mmetsp:Transcript_1302/g.1591  ORF Transcript_1302/g.1591 Transcript_1302/m.1591 type:complete len:102 (-) Transcript_1302:746-1051(-)